MPVEYSNPTINRLREAFREQKLFRPLKQRRYEPGDRLAYEIRGVFPAVSGSIQLQVEQFVGGGFAGQVYRIKVLKLDLPQGAIPGLETGRTYALKILLPPQGFARFFRSVIFYLAYQGPFAPQVNPTAARAGALWQKFIRRAAAIEMGDEDAVVDILATLVDPALGSSGEISEWVDGRLWRFEVDDDLDGRKKWKPGQPNKAVGSPEYRAKKVFMKRLVRLMHRMGAPELARQYEWWTCKSQPNVLKRRQADANPESGHTAVDFRAGLALLAFLPMSPVDVWLIIKGLWRGRLAQFDRGDLSRLKIFIEHYAVRFEDMSDAFQELIQADSAYRASLPDIFSHHLTLLFRPSLWRSILSQHMSGLVLRQHIDQKTAEKAASSRLKQMGLYFLGLLPFLGRILRRLYGHNQFRRHFHQLFTSPSYAARTWKARRAESLISWHRAGRVTAQRAERLLISPLRFALHMPLALLPAGLHRFLTDAAFARKRLDIIFLRPLRLYFKAEAREEWLQDMVSQGEHNGMLTADESTRIRSRIKEPFIQKYLKSLAVHVCTVPVTQIVSVLVAVIYVRLHPELSWQEASLRAGLILGLFQVIPISPGSLARGLYVTFLVIKERNFKDYNIAFFLSFFKYIGYLAFPIQMAYRYPDLARFMAVHWATGAVHVVPVFGERGALLEHAVFDLFYNYPLTVRRRLERRRKLRFQQKPRTWHWIPVVLVGLCLLVSLELVSYYLTNVVPDFQRVWWAAVWIPVMTAAAVTTWAGGSSLGKRLGLAVLSGAILGWLYAVGSALVQNVLILADAPSLSFPVLITQTAASGLWKAFIFGLIATITVLVVETRRLRA